MSRLVLLTGGSRGIGRATAELLRAHGWTVETPTRAELDFDKLHSVIKWATEALLDRDEMPAAIVFCHGYWTCESNNFPKEWLDQYWNRVIMPMTLLESFLRADKPPSVVVTVASNRGFFGGHDTGPYSAATAAQIALMTGYAREVPGTRFNCVAPSLTNTDMAKVVMGKIDGRTLPTPQPASVVAEAIVGLIESDANGKVLLVKEGVVTQARWEYVDPASVEAEWRQR